MKHSRVVEVKGQKQWDKCMEQARQQQRLVMVDFSANWCGPCKVMRPHFAQLSEAYPDILFLNIDVDIDQTIAAECAVTAMPTFAVISEGIKVDECVGAGKDQLRQLVEKWASSDKAAHAERLPAKQLAA